MGLKSTVKKVVGPEQWNRIRSVRQSYGEFKERYVTLPREAYRQRKRYRKYYSRPSGTAAEQIQARLIFHTHQIEKGLSHTQFRYGFGKNTLKEEAQYLKAYMRAVPNYRNTMPYQSAIAALHEYYERHEPEHKEAVEYAQSLFPAEVWKEVVEGAYSNGGSLVITANSKQNNRSATFSQIVDSRHSIREYANQPVTLDELMPALQMAVRTPSVCNRQPVRVHVVTDPVQIKQALKVQGGFNGYPMPPMLLLITADCRDFLNSMERNEGFTDAGLFAMSLMYALEAEGLAACPLNTMFNRAMEETTRSILSIPDYENLALYISVGHFPESVKTCVSERHEVTDIITVH